MQTSKDLHHFVLGQIQAQRARPAGLQHADDPTLLLHVMQAAMSQHPGVNLSEDEVRKIKECFRQEAREYNTRFSSYVQIKDYEPYWKDIDSMLDRMKKK